VVLVVEYLGTVARWDPVAWQWTADRPRVGGPLANDPVSNGTMVARLLQQYTDTALPARFQSRDYLRENGVEGVLWGILKRRLGSAIQLVEPLPVYTLPEERPGVYQ